MQNRVLKELKNKSRGELEKEVIQKSSELIKLKGELSAGRVKNVRQVKAGRVHLARIKTLLGQMQITAGAKQ